MEIHEERLDVDVGWARHTLGENGILRDFGEPLLKETPKLLLGGGQWSGHGKGSLKRPEISNKITELQSQCEAGDE